MKITVEITGLAYGGAGVGRFGPGAGPEGGKGGKGGKAVFVPYTAPGDVAEVELTAEKKSFAEGRLVRTLEPSPLRTEPRCRYFGDCGGCALQHISYPSQVDLKGDVLRETLRRIGRIEPRRFDPPRAESPPYGYRARARFHFSGGAMGFKKARSDEVVDIEDCPILTEGVSSAYSGIRAALMEAPEGVRKKLGALHEVEVAESPGRGGVAAAFHVTGGGPIPWDRLLSGVPGLKGFEVWMGPRARPGAPAHQGWRRLRLVASSGDGSIEYAVGDLVFRASVGVFTQVNRQGNLALVEKVVEYASPVPPGGVLDLFSGVGNFTLPVARAAGRGGAGGPGISGVESDPVAVRFARENAEANGLGGVRFVKGGAAEWLRQRAKALESSMPGVIILDPPRGGGAAVARLLAGLRPERVVYVSCSPPTLARDLSILAESGLRADRAVLVDMFPQTYHVECVVALSR
ncbi:MAG: class I SAM-dependent RNA methyltransferase [Thermodesulfobacteriota bacterium]